MHYNHLFGPVSSRRLGTSLGVDCVTAKTCDLDCIYCECGATTNCTVERKEYVPASAIIAELQAYLAPRPQLDFITFGGSGEPTLNSGIGTILRFVTKEYPEYKTALLTNGTLFHLPEVREDVMPFKYVLPSLDAVSPETFSAINRNHANLDVNVMIQGLITFAHEYKGTIWVEVFIVPGINDTPKELARFRDVLTRINPARVQLNSLDRPGTCSNVPQASPERLQEIAQYLLPLPVEIIARGSHLIQMPQTDADKLTIIMSTIQRRPLSLEEVAALGHMTLNEASALLNKNVQDGILSYDIVTQRWMIPAKE